MTDALIVYPSNMPCEVGFTAFLKCVNSHFTIMPLTTKEMDDRKIIERVLHENQHCKTVLFWGSYAVNALKDFFEEREQHLIFYCPAEPGVQGNKNVELIDGTKKLPFDFLLEFFEKYAIVGGTAMFTFFTKSHAKVLRYLEDRLFNRNIHENQVFFTGLFNSGTLDQSNFDKFYQYFDGTLNYDDIMKQGNAIVSSQTNLARERVKNNARTVEFKSGAKAIMTEGPELINLTHDQLHELHPDYGLTLVINLKFAKDDKPLSDTNCDEIGFSLRSYDKELDARGIIKHAQPTIRGDGNAQAAGGRMPFEIKIPF